MCEKSSHVPKSVTTGERRPEEAELGVCDAVAEEDEDANAENEDAAARAA